jgi:glutathione S-transferase
VYTLYYSPGTASLAVHHALTELGQPFELKLTDIEKGAQKSPDYLAVNPLGMIPTLLIEGRPYAECAAILLLLSERHPEARLAPAPGSPERAAFLQWMFYLANTVQPLFRRWFYAAEVAGPENEAAVKEVARQRLEDAWDHVDRHLAKGGLMAGPEFTVLDMLTSMVCRWSRNMPKPADRWPHIKAYLAVTTARPAFQEIHRKEGLEVWPARA